MGIVNTAWNVDVGEDCGAGFVQAGREQCDDANNINTDACVMGCKTATCGDGFVQAGTGQCDDATDVNMDACVAEPQGCEVRGRVRAGGHRAVRHPKMLVMPYRQYVAPYQGVRSFTGWTVNHEITGNNGNSFDTCAGVPGGSRASSRCPSRRDRRVRSGGGVRGCVHGPRVARARGLAGTCGRSRARAWRGRR